MRVAGRTAAVSISDGAALEAGGSHDLRPSRAVVLLVGAVLACLAALALATLLARHAPISRALDSRHGLQSHPSTRLPVSLAAAASPSIGASEHSFGAVRRGGAWLTDGGGIHGTFTARGAGLRLAQGTLGLSLVAVGHGKRLERVAAATPQGAANQVLYRHGSISESYRNGPYGLEQGFSLAKRPHADTGPLVLAIGLTGSLIPRQVRSEVLFRTHSGATALRYGQLSALDATGRRLPAHMQIRNGTLQLLIDDRSARYPLRIDPFVQLGGKLRGGEEKGLGQFGTSVAVSGNTALIGGPSDNGGVGAAWVFTRSGETWTQLGPKLTGGGETGAGEFGTSVALSGDIYTGNNPLLLIGGSNDNGGRGAMWVFTLSGPETFAERQKFTAPAFGGSPNEEIGPGRFGTSVALSGDGNTALIGAPYDFSEAGRTGSAWAFKRSGSTWSEQGFKKLVGGEPSGESRFGTSVALSFEANTALIGGPLDKGGVGAAWVFTRSGEAWSQSSPKLVGIFSGGEEGSGWFGASVALSGEGNTALIGGLHDKGSVGAAWVFTRSEFTWTQQGPKLTGSGESGAGEFGTSVALSGEANTALVGGRNDNSSVGAAWVFTRSEATWTQQGSKLTGSGENGQGGFGSSVALTGDGNTALIGGPGDSGSFGAAWAFVLQGPWNVYVADEGSNSVSQYESTLSGPLSPLFPATEKTHMGPTNLAVSPNLKSLYVTNEFSNSISQYRFEPGGGLRPKVPATVPTGIEPNAIATVKISSGEYAYVATEGGGPPPWVVYQYKMDANGRLASLGKPTAPDGHPQPTGIAVSPSGKYVYVPNEGDKTITQYKIEANGELTQLGTPSIATGTLPEGIAVVKIPSGEYAYVTTEEKGIWEYKIESNGELKHLSHEFIAAGNVPVEIAVTPNGKYAYATNYFEATVSQYRIEPGGELEHQFPSGVAAGKQPVGVAVTPDGKYVYVPDQAETNVSQYKIGPGGELEPLSPKTVTAATKPFGIVIPRGVVPTEAEPIPPPTVVTEPASSVTLTSATLNATVNPNGAEVTECKLEYGTSEAYGSSAPCTPSPGDGMSPVAVTASITGLTTSTIYHFRISATNAATISFGGDQTFKTLTPSPPTVVTGAASAVTQSAATLNATVNPNGEAVSDCHFDYGTSEAYGSSAPCTPSPGSGTSPVAVSASITGLTANTPYHFRIVATNPTGPNTGSDQTFTTLPKPPAVTTGAASSVTYTSATLGATVNPNGAEVTECLLEYGTSEAYGSSAPCTPSPRSGTSPVAVSASITGLTGGLTYHFRISAKNLGGTSFGLDRTFRTVTVPHYFSGGLGAVARIEEGEKTPVVSWGTLSLTNLTTGRKVTCRNVIGGSVENPVGQAPNTGFAGPAGVGETQSFNPYECESEMCTPAAKGGSATYVSVEAEGTEAPFPATGDQRNLRWQSHLLREGALFRSETVGLKVDVICHVQTGLNGKGEPIFGMVEEEKFEGSTMPILVVHCCKAAAPPEVEFDAGSGTLHKPAPEESVHGKTEGNLKVLGYNEEEVINAQLG